jgi:nondiscriminating glutamyl-tRNA synthetase
MIKTRFAPSPTGFLHVGNLRTALYSYLFTRKLGGVFMLRVEDTDRERFVEGGMENMLKALKWGGFEPDEGVILKAGTIAEIGDNGPYIQSNRTEIYRGYISKLISMDKAYHCFCTRERLEELRNTQQLNKQTPGYDGLCRLISPEDLEKRVGSGEGYVVRLKVPKEGRTVFTDLVRGEVAFENRLIDDQVLMKMDSFPTYHFAVVIDDHLMGVSHVIRGEEWLSSTPKHILMYQAFGWTPPIFSHLPLIVNEAKAKLSKRHGNVTVEDFKEAGYLAEALINFIALLGWNPGTEQEMFSLSELEKVFSMEGVGKSPSVFNRDKLNWFNKQYMMHMDLRELTARALPFFINAGLISTDIPIEDVMPIVELERSRVNTLAELVDATAFVFASSLEYDSSLLAWKKSTLSDAIEKLSEVKEFMSTISVQDWNVSNIESLLTQWIADRGYGMGDVLWPLRVALSGKKNSPGPFDLASVLGKNKSIHHIEEAIKNIK